MGAGRRSPRAAGGRPACRRRRSPRGAGAERREFGVGPTAYYQLLSRLIDDPAAIAYDPMLVKRLQRQRASRRRQRSRDRLSPHPSGGS